MERLMKGRFKSKFKKGLMATWDELDDEEDSDIEAEEVNLVLMAFTLSDSESELGSGFESDEKDEVYSNLSCYNLIHDLMIRCQDQARHMKVVKK